MFYRLIEEFDQKYNNVMGKVAELEAEKSNIAVRIGEAKKAYNDMIVAESLGDNKYSAADLSKAKKAIEKLEKEYSEIEEMVQGINDSRNEHLRKLLPEINTEFNKVAARVYSDIENQIPGLRECKARYIAFVYGLWVLHQEVSKAYQQLQRVHSITGDKLTRKPSMPRINFFNSGEGWDKCLAIFEHEIMEAYHSGKVAKWVQLFLETGEVVDNDQEAVKRFNEIKKEGNNNYGK